MNKSKIKVWVSALTIVQLTSARRNEQRILLYYKQWNPQMIGVGCGAHIVHSALKSACDTLPIDIEVFIVKIYSCFYIYTVCVEELKSFCEKMDIEYAQLLGYAKTRFLALAPVIDRVLNIFDALKSYFLSRKSEMLIKSYFNNPYIKLWLLFCKEQVIFFANFYR